MAEVLKPKEALDRFETTWRAGLGAVNLIGEFEVPTEQATLILRAVALIAKKQNGPSILRGHPACVAVSMATFAGAHYAGGALWASLFDYIDVADTPYLRAALGTAFLESLSRLDLPTVDEGLQYLGPITFHAVIPDYCLKDVLVLLRGRQSLNPALDGHSFLAWAGGHPSRLSDLDKPAARFLMSGGEYAADLVDRLLDLMGALGQDARDVSALVALSGAPVRMVRKAVNLIDSGAFQVSAAQAVRSRTSRSGTVERPQIELDLERSSVVLRLPQRDDGSDEYGRWRVTLDGALAESHRADPDIRELRRGHREVVIARPVRLVSAGMEDQSHVFDMDLVQADFPLLAFDRLGHFIAGTNPLPNDDVWLLYPESLGRPTGDGEQTEATIQLMGPVGWNGWALDRVSLKPHRRIGWGDQTRTIHHRGRPTLESTEPVLGLRTSSGEAVLAERPSVTLPRLATDTQWQVEIRDATTGQVLTDEAWTNDALGAGEGVEGCLDPFDGRDAPVVGEFDIFVRGPLGTRANWRVAVAEGLHQQTSVYCRTFVPGGLTPATLNWRSTTGLEIDPVRHEFAASERAVHLRVSSGEAALDLQCVPNHLEVCRVSNGEATEWAAAPLMLPSDGRNDLGVLEVRMAVDQSLPPLLLVCESGLTQTLPSTGGAGARQRFDLARILDTLRSEKVATLQWPMGDENTILARFRPDRLCSGAEIEGNELILIDFAGVPDVAAGLYEVMAPWRPPTVVSVSREGRAPLSDEVLVAGSLLVHARLDDPWVPVPWPRWPNRAFSLPKGGCPDPEDPGESLATHYLAGLTAVPRDQAAFPYLWVAWERANEIINLGAPRELLVDIPEVLGQAAGDAVEALMRTEVPRESALLLSMGAGLFSKQTDLSPALLGSVWRRFPALASTSAKATCELPWDEIVSVCGPAAEIIAGGQDGWTPFVGRFDNAHFLNAMPTRDFEELWQAAAIMPKGLLDVDARAEAGADLFRNRQKQALASLVRSGPELVRLAERLAQEEGQDTLRRWLHARITSQTTWPWEVLPQVSAAFAAVARLSSRGNDKALQLSTSSIGLWQTLARIAPGITEIDIVIAEMLIRADSDQYRPQSPEGLT